MLAEPGHSDGRKMGSKYPPSLRCCLPLWAVMLQVAFTLLFYFFISYDTLQVDQKLLVTYQGEEPGEMVRWARGRGCRGAPQWHRCSFLQHSPKGGSSPSIDCTEASQQCGLGFRSGPGFVSSRSPTWICGHRAGDLFVHCPEFPVQMVFITFYFSAPFSLLSFVAMTVTLCCHCGGLSLTHLLKNYFYYFQLGICVCVWVCANECRCSWEPEAPNPLGSGVTIVMRHPVRGAGI